jgi:hypothetical protein
LKWLGSQDSSIENRSRLHMAQPAGSTITSKDDGLVAGKLPST